MKLCFINSKFLIASGMSSCHVRFTLVQTNLGGMVGEFELAVVEAACISVSVVIPE